MNVVIACPFSGTNVSIHMVTGHKLHEFQGVLSSRRHDPLGGMTKANKDGTEV